MQMASSATMPAPAQGALTRLCRVDEVPEQGVIQVVPPGSSAEYAVYRLEDGFYCTDDMCTHGMVSLANGEIDNGLIICPLHGGAFDIRTGAATELPCRVALKVYKVEIIGDELFAALG
jgi:nitrite reductase/ring-hydroxylating ferredoxin subunit